MSLSELMQLAAYRGMREFELVKQARCRLMPLGYVVGCPLAELPVVAIHPDRPDQVLVLGAGWNSFLPTEELVRFPHRGYRLSLLKATPEIVIQELREGFGGPWQVLAAIPFREEEGWMSEMVEEAVHLAMFGRVYAVVDREDPVSRAHRFKRTREAYRRFKDAPHGEGVQRRKDLTLAFSQDTADIVEYEHPRVSRPDLWIHQMVWRSL